MSSSRAALAAAFARTIYRAYLPGQAVDVRIGARHPQLDAWLRAEGAQRWAIFSPCNPGARLLEPAANAARMAGLRAHLARVGLRHVPAEGIPPAGEEWPPEPSLLILDLLPEHAQALAWRYGQLAWVAGEVDQPALLVWSSPKV